MPRRITDQEVQDRAGRLWGRHKKNGGMITRAEVVGILGVKNWSTAYCLFKKHSVSVPIPDDTPRGKLAKRADILNSTGKDVLTTREIADLLDLKGATDARVYYDSIAGHFDVPRLIGVQEEAFDKEMPPSLRETFYDMHPSGMQAEPKRRLPDGRIVYELR